jgi:hypothetical protein
MDWKECEDKKLVKEVNVDENLAASLLKSSLNKLKSAQRLELDEVSSASKVSLTYESLREVLEALAIKKGFKIYNHECFCSFLKEVCNEVLDADKFDDFRIIRNKINYYGKDIPLSEAELLIEGMSDLRERIIKNYFRGAK